MTGAAILSDFLKTMRPPPGKVDNEKLSDRVAWAVKSLIDSGGYETGDRLPTIAEMAGMFEVGAPTLREALKKLQAASVIHIKHGAGIFVAENHNALFVPNPVLERKPTKKVILDLMETRLAVEPFTAGLAADNATEAQIERMGGLLDSAREFLDKGESAPLAEANLAYHREISIASGNGVISQLLALITGLFQIELYAVLEIYGSTERDYVEHRSILAAIKKRNRTLAVRRMRNHLTSVRVAIEQYYDLKEDETV